MQDPIANNFLLSQPNPILLEFAAFLRQLHRNHVC